jgi:hypothetical protein
MRVAGNFVAVIGNYRIPVYVFPAVACVMLPREFGDCRLLYLATVACRILFRQLIVLVQG